MPRKIYVLLLAVLCTGVMCASTRAASATPGSDKAGDASPSSLTVVRAVACRNVLDREPVDVTGTFTTADERAYVFCEIAGGAGRTIRHVYYHNGAYVTAVELNVRSDSFRTWSYKSLWPGAGGSWRVDIVTGDDTVLTTVTFDVAEPDATA